MLIVGPGHGGPAAVANAYLEGTYTEVYPEITRDENGLAHLFRQFSFPGGIPSHVAPETPGSIHEGGELGYALSHAYGAAFDNPDLLVCCGVGDGEAETGPLATSWHSNKFLNPVTDGAVLPILHLNGYKIANPTILARIGDGSHLAIEGTATASTGSAANQATPADGGRARRVVRRSRRSTIRARRATPRGRAGDDRAAVAEGLDGPRRSTPFPKGAWRSHRCPSPSAHQSGHLELLSRG
jgi:xylulose-5-phosphate/fructose-6-phosphate phosphoketolase